MIGHDQYHPYCENAVKCRNMAELLDSWGLGAQRRSVIPQVRAGTLGHQWSPAVEAFELLNAPRVAARREK